MDNREAEVGGIARENKDVILPFVDRFPKDIELYRIMTTKLSEVSKEKEG